MLTQEYKHTDSGTKVRFHFLKERDAHEFPGGYFSSGAGVVVETIWPHGVQETNEYDVDGAGWMHTYQTVQGPKWQAGTEVKTK